MKWHVQIVRPSTYNVESTSVLVHFPDGRYLFNCGEGLQRLSFENKVRVSKLSAIFVSRVNWETMGGLPGMLLTMSDSGVQGLTLNGGHNLTHALAATRHFIARTKMGINVNEMRDGDAAAEFRDTNLHVTPVHIYPQGYTVTDSECGPDESEELQLRQRFVVGAFGKPKQAGLQAQNKDGKSRKKKQQQQQPQQGKKGYYNEQCSGAAIEEHLQRLQQAEEEALRKKRAHSPEASRQVNSSDMLLPSTTPSPAALCFIVEGPEVPGKFDVQAAQTLGLRPGPLYSKLTVGESVVGPDGTTIHPWQCIGPSRPGSIVIIIDCPSTDYIASLTANPMFTSFLDADGKDEEKQKQLLMVIHGLGKGVAQDSRYQAWAARFPSHIRHVVSAPEFVPDSNPFQRHLRVHTAMAAVDSNVFVLPQSSKTAELSENSFLNGKNVVIPDFNMAYDIVPKFKLDTSTVPVLMTSEDMYQKALAMKNRHLYDSSLPWPVDTHSSFESGATENKPDDSELVICPIGTGSSVPSNYRNVSSNIISVRGYGGIILDCGESTVSLLKRFLGYPNRNHHNTRINKSYVEFVASLKLLYISHMHADHHLGAVLLLQEWSQLTKSQPLQSRLNIVAPWRFWSWLKDISGVQDIGFDRLDFIGCHDLRMLSDNQHQHPNQYQHQQGATNEIDTQDILPLIDMKIGNLKADLGLIEISTCHVVHCPWAYGLSITHESGWRVVYSGDTRPCGNLVTLGRAGNKPPTVLLHEATHSDDLITDAIAKRHSTVSEAVAMALGMGAKNLLITHFSQRCMTVPRWDIAKVLDVKVARYGYVAQAVLGNAKDMNNRSLDLAASAASAVADEEEVREDSQTMDISTATEGPALLDNAKAEKEALLKDINEPASDDDSDTADDTGSNSSSKSNISDTSQQRRKLLSRVNIASAFDMSAFGVQDFMRAKKNSRSLRHAAWEELKLLLAEENEGSDMEVKGKKENKNANGKKRPVPKKAARAPFKAKK
ncbi:hypothetical protein GGI25_000141 [Coemansia spiralis]|uniref:ribonuclease Z n=2 Tax=Coemansia TaxID=4863 RepID=A0A9W8GCP2_9FUNG|nr:hypothetical protein EDC05_002787 [Coemansia umbellata]KAJ2621799.1 hypothetical protein GGI26_003779 [Coemansia sp. RSA 1358]KAJ2681186.1 hypothetical protein GGI25_000141 [Coemansia spiralis]